MSCAHGVWLSESDIDILAETGTAICTNPSSNLRLKSGIAPINRLLESEVMVALGIDEAGINDDNDILQEMRMAQKIHREPGVDAPYPTSHEILELATANGAKVTYFDEVGTIEPGKRADLVVLNLDRIEDPYLHPGHRHRRRACVQGQGTRRGHRDGGWRGPAEKWRIPEGGQVRSPSEAAGVTGKRAD